MKRHIVIYTDGSYKPQKKVGGWAAHIELTNGKTILLSGEEQETTNNRMELLAVIEALNTLETPSRVTIYSDSQYVVNAVKKGWVYNWSKNNFMSASYKGSKPKPVKNKDLFLQLLDLLDIHNVTMIWVKGHADNEMNNLVDQVAQSAADNLFRKLEQRKKET